MLFRRRLRLLLRRFLPLWVCLLPCAFVELCSFRFASLFWPPIPSYPELNSTRILIVADPQLIGHRNEPKRIGWLSRWDSDRYLRRGYGTVLAAMQPDLELFLGDLFDEGVFMEDKEEFGREFRRFLTIYPVEERTNRIYVAGDNDIGGEFEPVYVQRYERFKRHFKPHFGEKSTETLGMLCIYEGNPLTSNFDGIYGSPDRGDQTSSIRVLLTHFPVVRRMTAKMEQELRRINIVLSAHDHTTALYMQWRHSPQFRRIAAAAEVSDARWTISMSDPPALPLLEFKSPTVSYRMGVPAMGFGLLTLTPFPANRTALVQFSVLWLPSRYLQLGLYASLAALCVLWTLLAKFGLCPSQEGTRKGRKWTKLAEEKGNGGSKV